MTAPTILRPRLLDELEATRQRAGARSAAMTWTHSAGYVVRRDGWIFTSTGRPVCQGLEALADMLQLRGWIRRGVVLEVPDRCVRGDRP